jgi:hypothetical protein
MPPKQNTVTADLATEAAKRVGEITEKLETKMVDKKKFEEAKTSWTKLETECDHRINKLNDFSVSVIKNLNAA